MTNMGLRFTVKGADFSEKAVNYVPPVGEGLEYLNFFGGADKLGRNLAPGKPSGQVVGSPAFTANSMTPLQMLNYIQTGVPHTDEMTFMVVAKGPTDDVNSHLISNFWSSRVGGVGNTVGASVMTMPVAPSGDGIGREALAWSAWDGVSSTSLQITTNMPPHPVAEMKAIAATISKANRVGEIFNKTAGLSVKGAPLPDGTTTDLGGEFRIGSAYLSVSGAQPSEILFVAIWSRVLSEAEIDVMYQAAKGYYAIRGVAI